MSKLNQDFKVKDSVVIILGGLPVQTEIVKKVTTETLNEKKEVVPSVLYFTSATGADAYKDSIYRDKADMLKSLGDALSDAPGGTSAQTGK